MSPPSVSHPFPLPPFYSCHKTHLITRWCYTYLLFIEDPVIMTIVWSPDDYILYPSTFRVHPHMRSPAGGKPPKPTCPSHLLPAGQAKVRVKLRLRLKLRLNPRPMFHLWLSQSIVEPAGVKGRGQKRTKARTSVYVDTVTSRWEFNQRSVSIPN